MPIPCGRTALAGHFQRKCHPRKRIKAHLPCHPERSVSEVEGSHSGKAKILRLAFGSLLNDKTFPPERQGHALALQWVFVFGRIISARAFPPEMPSVKADKGPPPMSS